jgi:hypothetical protein
MTYFMTLLHDRLTACRLRPAGIRAEQLRILFGLYRSARFRRRNPDKSSLLPQTRPNL